jgi:flagellar FliL protein
MPNAEPEGKKSKGGLSILGLILLSLIAAGSGVGFGMVLPGLVEPAKKPQPEESKAAEAHGPGAHLLPLTPITTNLSQPAATWVRLESMLVANQDLGVDGSVMVKRLSEDILGYLRTVSLDQISGPSGFQHLREDLNDRVRIRSEGKVSGIVITSLILE